ncbi:MAG: HAD hydrolase-like protein [Oscillospiraceae bacterium]|jgi:phosphoglycolate phosphatase|nr:HAD hydrolase-like protein [Oscillospiraceae bacterium]
MFSTVAWDWNGTLLDDLDAAVGAVNALLEARGLAALDNARYKEIFTFPVIDFYRRAGFAFEIESFEDVAARFVESYMKQSRTCRLFDDAPRALERLREAGLSQVLLTASYEQMLLAQLSAFDIKDCFDELIAQKDALARGKTDSARLYMRDKGIDPREMVLIGDSEHDCDVADELGAACILVPRGHHGRDRLEARMKRSGSQGVVLDNLTDAAEWIVDGLSARRGL